jgi:hypothetical protein
LGFLGAAADAFPFVVAAPDDFAAFAFVGAADFCAAAPDAFAARGFVATDGFVAAADVVVAAGLAFVTAGAEALPAVAVAVLVVRAGRAAPRRSPPSRVGLVDLRLPRTLGSAFAAFLGFFFVDFSAMGSTICPRSAFHGLKSMPDARLAALTSKNIAPRLTP